MSHLQIIDRRAVLAGGAAAGTAVALSATDAFGDEVAEVQRLIDEHRTAWLALGEISDRLEEMEHAYRQAHFHLVPMSLTGGGGYEIGVLSDLEIRSEILRTYGGQRQNLRWLCKLAPELADKVKATVDEAQEKHLQIMEQCFREEEARTEAFGLAEVRRRYSRACNAETKALRALCGFPCATAEGWRCKASYLLEHSDEIGEDGDLHVELLLRSMIDGRAA